MKDHMNVQLTCQKLILLESLYLSHLIIIQERVLDLLLLQWEKISLKLL